MEMPKIYVNPRRSEWPALTARCTRQEEEIGETRWIPLEQAHTWVTFRNDKNLISKAKKILLPE